MKKFILPIATIITFILIPLLGLIFRNWYAPHLHYGHGDATVNSVLLLLYGIFAFFVSAFHFIQCHNSWKTGNSTWKVHLFFTYLFVFTIAISVPFLITFKNIDFKKISIGIFADISPLFLLLTSITLFLLVLAGFKFLKKSVKSHLFVVFSIFITILFLSLMMFFMTKTLIAQNDLMVIPLMSPVILFPIGLILLCLCLAGLYHIGSGAMPYLFMIIFIVALIVVIYVRYFSPVFILPSGIILLFLGIGGFKQLKAKPKIYLFITFLMSLLFLLGGAPSAFIVFAWWIKGGINPW